MTAPPPKDGHLLVIHCQLITLDRAPNITVRSIPELLPDTLPVHARGFAPAVH